MVVPSAEELQSQELKSIKERELQSHQGAAVAGLRCARLPGGAEELHGGGYQSPLLQGSGQRREPGAARGFVDSRAAVPVKEYAFRNPHSMGKWARCSKTVVRSMEDGDCYSRERSVCIC